jgi:uncharacterized protein YyaL (SSP411 family)
MRITCSPSVAAWPLTMFLEPDGTPFYSDTYFPKQARYGLPGFPDLLLRITKVYKENRKELSAQGEQLIATLASWQTEKNLMTPHSPPHR